MTISEITKTFRKQEALTLAKFGEMLGVTRQAVNHWELCRTKPAYSFLIATTMNFRDWRRDWALKCLDLYLDQTNHIATPVNQQAAPEQPAA